MPHKFFCYALILLWSHQHDSSMESHNSLLASRYFLFSSFTSIFLVCSTSWLRGPSSML